MNLNEIKLENFSNRRNSRLMRNNESKIRNTKHQMRMTIAARSEHNYTKHKAQLYCGGITESVIFVY